MAIEARGVARTYEKAGHHIRVLAGVDLSIAPGERVAILGPSGSGKSTFLHLLGLLDRPTAGSLRLGGVEVATLPGRERDRLRNREIGFVFQSHNLLPEHDALANVMIPARLGGATAATARARAEAVLVGVGLGARLRHRPGELSGGEQQRVAMARALVMGPSLVLADEPTGNLDPDTAGGVFSLLLSLHEQLGSTLVVVTHSHELAAHFPRQLRMSGGRFVESVS